MSLKDDLIKLGERQPDLQDNIRPVLDRISSSKMEKAWEDIAQSYIQTIKRSPFSDYARFEPVEVEENRGKIKYILKFRLDDSSRWKHPEEHEEEYAAFEFVGKQARSGEKVGEAWSKVFSDYPYMGWKKTKMDDPNPRKAEDLAKKDVQKILETIS